MLFRDITILDEKLEEKEHAYVGIKNGRIDYIDTEPPMHPEEYGEVYEGKNRLLMSGFFNAHAHTPMILMRGYGENMKLHSWLNDRIFPFEAKLNGKDIYWATMLGLAESIQFGIVSSTDMYYFGDEMAKAVSESGAKDNLSIGMTCFTDQDVQELDRFRESNDLFSFWNGASEGRVQVDLSIHAEYTSTPKMVRQMAEQTKKLGARMHIHVSETRAELEECKERHQGKTPVAYLNDLGAFDGPTTAAHCIWLEGEDFDILREKEVNVATCPISNLKLASGICNVPELLRRGISVSIGTDSVASNNSLNMIEEVKVFALIHKQAFGDPTLITPKQALHAATAAGAKGQGRADTGVLAQGKKADLIVLDLDRPHMKPVYSLLNNLVYSASGSDVVLTMVDGQVLYRNGEFLTVDVEQAAWQVEQSKNRILKEL